MPVSTISRQYSRLILDQRDSPNCLEMVSITTRTSQVNLTQRMRLLMHFVLFYCAVVTVFHIKKFASRELSAPDNRPLDDHTQFEDSDDFSEYRRRVFNARSDLMSKRAGKLRSFCASKNDSFSKEYPDDTVVWLYFHKLIYCPNIRGDVSMFKGIIIESHQKLHNSLCFTKQPKKNSFLNVNFDY